MMLSCTPKIIRVLLGAVLATITCAVAAQQPANNQPNEKLELLTDLVVGIVPIGVSMESMMAKSDYWPRRTPPANGNLDAINCFREQLSVANYKKFVREQVGRYAQEYPKRIDSDIELLSGSGGKILGRLFVEDGTNVLAPGGFDFEKFSADFSRKDKTLARELLFAEKHYPLRALVGLGNKLSGSASSRTTSRKEKFDLVVEIRAEYLMSHADSCPGIGSELVQPSERFPEEFLTIIYRVKRPDKDVSQEKPRRIEKVLAKTCKSPAGDAPKFGLVRPTVQSPRLDPSSPLQVPRVPDGLIPQRKPITVVVAVFVNQTGTVDRSAIDDPTDIPELNEIVLDAPKRWRFIPGAVDNQPSCMWIALPLVFR